MNNYTFERLDYTNEVDKIKFEKELYNAYKKDGGWYFKNFMQMNNRLIAAIDYKYLRIAVVKKNNEIIGGMLSNINYKEQFLIEKMGFILKKDNTCCEGINTFVSDAVDEKDKMKLLIQLGDFAKKILMSENIKIVYAAPQTKYINIHNWIFEYDEELEIKKIDDEERCLMKKYL